MGLFNENFATHGQRSAEKRQVRRGLRPTGAKSVLMSLWNVAESSSVDLVTSFFKHLREGKNKLEALKLARDEIRKAGYDHPFFWAPFILVGEVD